MLLFINRFLARLPNRLQGRDKILNTGSKKYSGKLIMNRSSNIGFGLVSIAVVVCFLGISAMFTQASAATMESTEINEIM